MHGEAPSLGMGVQPSTLGADRGAMGWEFQDACAWRGPVQRQPAGSHRKLRSSTSPTRSCLRGCYKPDAIAGHALPEFLSVFCVPSLSSLVGLNFCLQEPRG